MTDSVCELDIQTHRRIGSFHSLPEYILHDDDASKTLRSEIIQGFRNQELFMLDAYDVNHDAPCSSKQDQVSIIGGNVLRLLK